MLHRAAAAGIPSGTPAGAGGAANQRGAPALGCPLVWVCGYRCGTLACGWMSTTHAWWPKSVGMLNAEATMTGVLTAVSAWAGAARPRMAADEPASDDGGKSELVHCGAFFFLSAGLFEPGREVAVRRLCRPVMMVPLHRSNAQNTQVRVLIPVAVFGRWLAETGQRRRPGALNWTPMSDPGHAAGRAALANTSKVTDARAASHHLVSWCPARPRATRSSPGNASRSFGRAAAVSDLITSSPRPSSTVIPPIIIAARVPVGPWSELRLAEIAGHLQRRSRRRRAV